MRTPAHCDKSPLKEITLKTKEKQCFKEEGMLISMFGVQLSYLGTAIGLFCQNHVN
jgi:hypothetical protein